MRTASTTVFKHLRQLGMWYVTSAALLLIRVPVTGLCIFMGLQLWESVVVAWAVERPFYYYLAVWLNRRFTNDTK